MNQIQHIQRINEAELEAGGSSSWHDQYKDSAYVNVGGLPFNLTEGDVITIFSQYGEVVDINMPRDPQTGKPRGFAWLMYMDQRSTVLAVDNLNGAQVLGRTLRVDHVLDYKQLEKDQETGKMKERESQSLAAHPEKFMKVAEGSDYDSDSSHPSIDLDDPMRDYLIEQKRAAKKRRIDSAGGESKEERKRKRDEKRKEKEARRADREKRRERRTIEGKGGRDERGDDRSRRDERLARRDDSRERRRDYSPRRGADRRRDYSPGRDSRRRDDDDDRRRDDRDRDRDYRRRDERDDRDRRGGGSGGRSGAGDAFADLERWVRG
ncbi:hypothetical protein JCM10207_001556 [Rhodosporidiobolus poonsookiae]